MDYSAYLFDGTNAYQQGIIDPGDKHALPKREKGESRLAKNREQIGSLQSALYAESERSLLIIFQAMDAAGKDGAIQHVFTGINPQGIRVHSFKQPSAQELARDFLWRAHKRVPARGQVCIFNRSHYEDVLISRVLDLPSQQHLPDYVLHDIWDRRYRQIREFEQMLYENGTTIIKFYLHLSQDEQKARFAERAKRLDKNWKFSQGDVLTSEKWDAYMTAYAQAINETAAPYAPWYVIPADRKWYARAIISQVVLDTLRRMNPQYPSPTEAQLDEIDAYLSLATGEEDG